MRSRRVSDRTNRASRIAASATIGAPVAVLVAWLTNRFIGAIPPEIGAAIGALVASVVVCFHDVLRYAAAYVIHRFQLPKPPDQF